MDKATKMQLSVLFFVIGLAMIFMQDLKRLDTINLGFSLPFAIVGDGVRRLRQDPKLPDQGILGRDRVGSIGITVFLSADLAWYIAASARAVMDETVSSGTAIVAPMLKPTPSRVAAAAEARRIDDVFIRLVLP